MEEKYLPELMAEKDSLDPSFTHALRLVNQGEGLPATPRPAAALGVWVWGPRRGPRWDADGPDGGRTGWVEMELGCWRTRWWGCGVGGSGKERTVLGMSGGI